MQNMYYIGLDVHKKTISYCVKNAEGSILATLRRRCSFSNRLKAVRDAEERNRARSEPAVVQFHEHVSCQDQLTS
jgi:hypothetical protein